MKVYWYGHAAFMISTGKGTRIIIDPYEFGAFDGALSYGKIQDEADIVLTTHDHADHNYVKDIKGSYQHIRKEGAYETKDVKIEAIPVFHDQSGGKERGRNLIFVIKADDMVLVHLGDLGHPLDADVLKKISPADILLCPVGGFFTIDAAVAAQVVNGINPRIIIPMHFKTEKCGFPIAPVADFTKDRKNVRVLNTSELQIDKNMLPKETETVVLQHAL